MRPCQPPLIPADNRAPVRQAHFDSLNLLAASSLFFYPPCVPVDFLYLSSSACGKRQTWDNGELNMRGLTILVAVAILSAFAPGIVSAQSVDPAILSVIVDGRKFLITGRNLPTGSGRKVVIGEGLKLRIKPGATEDFIVARMPSGTPLLEPGTYRMVVQKLDTKVLFNVVVPLVDESEQTRYVWLPTADAVVRFGDSAQAHTEIESFGRTCVEQDASGSLLVDVILPIQISTPIGRSSQIKAARIFYEARASTAFISRTDIQGRDFNTGQQIRLVTDSTQRQSTSFDSYTVEVTENGEVSDLVAPTNVTLQLRMTTVGSSVCLYGVRLELD